jgi:hypothetical protein
MNRNCRERIPPPALCMSCAHRVTYRGVSPEGDRIEIRNRCGKDKPMHPDCAWHEKGPK